MAKKKISKNSKHLFRWATPLVQLPKRMQIYPKRIHESPKPIRITLVICIPFETDKTVYFFILFFKASLRQ